MNEHLNRVKLAGSVFMAGAKKQAMDEHTIEIATTVGILQGIKYNGNLDRGIKAGVTTLIVLSSVTGVRNVIKNWDTIKVNAAKMEGA